MLNSENMFGFVVVISHVINHKLRTNCNALKKKIAALKYNLLIDRCWQCPVVPGSATPTSLASI